jgi:hypothetical protein
LKTSSEKEEVKPIICQEDTMNNSIATKQTRERVEAGKKVESAIIAKLNEIGMKLSQPTNSEDILQKVDAWYVNKQGTRVGIQIKYRESGSDLLFEVFDTFVEFKSDKNKMGRDMIGLAKEYAVLIENKIIIVEKQKAIDVINEMLDEARCNGWSKSNGRTKTLFYESDRCELQMKLQDDPADGRKKIVAYIPKEFFQANLSVSV